MCISISSPGLQLPDGQHRLSGTSICDQILLKINKVKLDF